MSLATARNIAIVLVIAAVVAVVPGGGTGATVAFQALSLIFLATLGWLASVMYRQHRTALYSVGDTRRAVLYAAVAVAAVVLTGTSRLWHTGAGSVVWLLLLGAAAYAVIAIFLAARKY
jgi:hypothetical protein